MNTKPKRVEPKLGLEATVDAAANSELADEQLAAIAAGAGATAMRTEALHAHAAAAPETMRYRDMAATESFGRKSLG